MSQTEQILLELFETYPQSTIGEIAERTGLARRTIQKYLTLLAVLKNDLLVGKLSYGNGAYSFEYDAQYKGTALMGIPGEDKIKVPIFYPVFENLLPEYERRDKLLSTMADSADILSKLYNVQGDFKFIPYFELFKYKSTTQARPAWHTVKHKILEENSYPNLIDAKILISDEILEEASKREHSSLSGYQHKIDINLDLEKGTIEESERDADFHYIVKCYDRHEQYAYGQYDMAQLLNIPSDKKYKTDTLMTIL